MIIVDTETTDLIHNSLLPLAQQPRIIEFAAQKLDDNNLQFIDQISFLVNPGVPIPPHVVKTTGIDDGMVKDAKPFSTHYPALVDFFLGERKLVAHNLPHDVGCLALELRRLDMEHRFPWPHHHICTVELSQYFNGKYLKLTELYQQLFDREPSQEHRAMSDVELLVECVRALHQRGLV
jgi:DNA polymerase-3 subunit epsilon